MNKPYPETTVTPFDRVNGALSASIIVTGFVVLALFAVWLTLGEQEFGRLVFPIPSGESELMEMVESDDQWILDSDDFKKSEEPGLDLKLTLVQALASDVQAKFAISGSGNSVGFDARRGPGDEPNPGKRDHASRWQVRFEAQDATEYAQQLDHFGIEIGALDAESEKIIILSDLGNQLIRNESDRQSQSERLYFVHRNSRMQRWESRFCQKAGVSFDNLITCQFFPEDLQHEMAQLELQAAKSEGREIDEIDQTRFEIVTSSAGYRIVVRKIIFLDTLDN